MTLATWTAHPARRRPRDVLLVTAVTLVVAGAVLGTMQSAWMAIVAVAMLVGAVSSFLFPTRYEITDTAIEERRALRRRVRRWGELRRVQVGRDAALVSPFARPSWLDRHRGIVVLFDGGDRERIIALLRERVAAGGAASAQPVAVPGEAA
jgi:hypothetical protein